MEQPPNIILLTFDALREDFLGYNSDKVDTPHIDEFAQNNLHFTNTYSTASWTAPSFKSIFTGYYPLEKGGRITLNSDDSSFIEILQNKGYHTLGFPHHPYLCRFYGFEKGFDVFKDGIDFGNTSLSEKIKRKILETDIGNYMRLLKSIFTRHSCTKLETIIEEFFDCVNQQPFFCWIHSLDTHTPFTPPEEFESLTRKRSFEVHKARHDFRTGKITEEEFRPYLDDLKKLYRDEIRYIDREFGRFIDRLKSNDLYENTIIILTSDHGEEFLEHGNLHHQRYIYNELVHVPLIMKVGNKRETRHDICSLNHLGPTVLDIADIDGSNRLRTHNSLLQNTKNHAFMNAAEGDVLSGDNPKPYLQGEKKIGIRRGKWHYIHNFRQQDELFNLEIDKEEQKNLINQEKVPNDIQKLLGEHKSLINTSILNEVDI
jgi:arylsulfatase